MIPPCRPDPGTIELVPPVEGGQRRVKVAKCECGADYHTWIFSDSGWELVSGP